MTRTAWIAAAFPAALAASLGSAQDPEAALADLRSCLDGRVGVEARECVGVYARDCMAAPGGDTTLAMAGCTTAEAAAWDRVLDETFAELVILSRDRMALDEQAGVAPDPLDELLREAQGAWLTFRDADCAQEYAVWGGGSMRRIAGAWCRLDRTSQRLIELRAKRDALAAE
jgi:uncharacterized protein YecT (DUF1311 family)